MNRKAKYKLIGDGYNGTPAGTVVFEYFGADYGLCGDDFRLTGKPHIAVSVSGKAPFFTTPKENLELVAEAK